MFASLRWRLATLFVLLSALVFVTLTLLTLGLFHLRMTAALDEELAQVSSVILPHVTVVERTPSLPKLAEDSKIISNALVTVQVYDRNGLLKEQYGPEGIPELGDSHTEKRASAYSLRVLSVPLVRDGELVGYLQLQHPTNTRDNATQHFALAMAMISPLIFVCLGTAGYFFASRAVQPVEDSMRILKQFIADAGHELSTPISIIQANAEAIDEELEDQGMAAGRMDVITRSTERMSTLVDDLMVLARTTSPRLLSATTQVKFHVIVASIVQEFTQLFKEKGIDLQSSEVQECIMAGNPEALKKLVSNLLSNALRYTDRGGTVKVSLAHDGHHAHLQVADTGIGIPSADIPHIFDRFFRVDKSRSRAAGGSGLGLAIAKAIVDAHHGKIEVESKEGEGTRFSVNLPLRG